jgi:hypothetical protein
MKKQDQKRLEYWQTKVKEAKAAWQTERDKMDRREKQYMGDRELRKIIAKDKLTETQHVWNITAENIESIVDSNIPKPKVTPRREKDQRLASIIEHMINNELDRLKMEEINDLQERTCPIQGGTLYLVEWDNGETGGDRDGEVQISSVHPKMLIPQPGVYTGIEDMDYVCLLVPDTKANIKRVYGVDVTGEADTDPETRGLDTKSQSEEEMVTRYMVYYRNGDAIGKFHFVGETVLEDLEDYQARRKRRCAKCGALENTEGLILNRHTEDGSYPEDGAPDRKAEKGICPYCGSNKWEDSNEEYFEILTPVQVGEEVVGGYEPMVDEQGNVVAVATERIPYYNPRVYPVVLQRNVSIFGQLLGDSDVDKIQDQQNTVNRMEQKILDRVLMSGTRASLPPDSKVTVSPDEGEVWRLESIDHKNYLGVFDFAGDISQPLAVLNQVYQESRNILGITDSYQGRADTTATSGKAKQFSAQQSAGRMESKRVMKNAAYAKLFELIFKLKLAYCDEPRPVFYEDKEGETIYETFDKMDFLERDANGEWRWNTDFLFSVDDSGGLAGNRSAMWQELTAQFQAGAMGNPQEIDTQIDYWAAMEELHYPTAGKIKKRLVERKNQITKAQQLAAAVAPPVNAAGMPGGTAGAAGRM